MASSENTLWFTSNFLKFGKNYFFENVSVGNTFPEPYYGSKNGFKVKFTH